MSESTTLLAVGARGNHVVLSFPHAVRECVIDADTARQVGEQLARQSYAAHYGHEPPAAASAISAAKRAHLRARATLMLRTMLEARADAGYMARELVAMLLAEV